MQEIIKLDSIILDMRSYDGTWCCAPYPKHPKGCYKFPKCIESNLQDAKFYLDKDLQWYAIIEEFDLEAHVNKMKLKFPNWTIKQCQCVLYWQSSVKKKLKEKAYKFADNFDDAYVTLCPEALGINVFGTMAKHGLILYKNPKLVRKIAFVGVVI